MHAATFSTLSEKSRTIGGSTSQKEPSCVQTQVTSEGFMMVWKSVWPHYSGSESLAQFRRPMTSHWQSIHFEPLVRALPGPFSANRIVQDTAIQHIPQQTIKPELVELPILEETTKAIKQLKSGKAAGGDGIQPRSGNMAVKLFTVNSRNSFSAVESRESFHEIFVMQLSSLCTKTKV